MPTTTEELVFEKIRQLQPQQQQQVLEFVDALIKQQVSIPEIINPFGLWADLEIEISEDDITEVRKQIWVNFPREEC